MFYIHKGTISKCTKKMSEEEIQEFLNNGWEPGKCPAHWVNNGIDDILLKEGLPMPDGYVYGQSDIFKQKNSVGGKRRWKEATEEKREEWSQAASKATC